MTVFYFTSTGNSLAVAKTIGGTLISIPQVVDSGKSDYTDDAIGVVFPIYGFGLPKMVRRFLENTKLKAGYIFAIGTYGNKDGACMRNVQKLARKHGYAIHYAKSLLMVDNYLPGFDVADQIAMLPQKKTDAHLAEIKADIDSRKPFVATASAVQRAMTAVIKSGEKLVMKGTQAQGYAVTGQCVKCGICARVCPTGNIAVEDKVRFADKCEWCLGCVHLCPNNAIHIKGERSNKRWRNPDVSLNEIIEANNRT
jgi:ferredoxin